MAEFGWAYVAGGAITGSAGPIGSIVIKESDTQLTGSGNLKFLTATNTVVLTGHMSSSGFVSASSFVWFFI